MYSLAEFAPLSQASMKKLMKGNAVRVKHGSGLKLHLSKAQMKKHLSTKMKGKGYNLTLDPYQADMTGKGFFDDVGSAFKKVGTSFVTNVAKPVASEIVKEGKTQGRKVASALIHEGIPLAGATLGGIAGATLGGLSANPLAVPAGEIIGNQLGSYGATKLADYIGQKTGYGMMDMLKPLLPIAKKALIAVGKEVGKKALSKGLDYAQQKALDYGVNPEVVSASKQIALEIAKNPKSLDLKEVDAESLLKEIVEGPLQQHPMFLKVQDKMREMFGHGMKMTAVMNSPQMKKAMKPKLLGEGMRKGGQLLIDQPFTARQAVDTTGKFFKDPAKTIGFGHPNRIGGTMLIDQPFTARQAVDTTGKFIKDPAKTLGFGLTKKMLGKALVQAGYHF